MPLPGQLSAEINTLGYAGRSLPVPEEVPDGLAAALGNAGLAGWLPLSWRAAMQKGETVLVLGATGTTGLISVAAARLLGAGRVVAAGRNPAALQTTLSVGADATLNLQADDLNHRLVAEAGNGFDIVIDYLNGPATQAAMHAMATGGRLVQIGSALGSEISVPAQLARKLSLSVLGFAYYHAPLALQAEAYLAVCAAAIAGGIPIDYREMPLNEVMAAWALQKGGDSCRKVMIPGPASPVLIPGNQ
ncbi:zinc-binding dehydrogenase [Sphingobium fluviale]|nr:zinc-binding dehydrogenase [Sphingobium fluviale]